MPLAYPKPLTRRTLKARKAKAERAVKRDVRAECVDRDGYCRYMPPGYTSDPHRILLCISACEGPSEWAHLRGHRRSQTRKQAPERRHTTTHSLMLCRRHHAMEERGALVVTALTEAGCDGPIRFALKGRTT